MSSFDIARHMAQDEGYPPRFIKFAERDTHDLDAVARQCVEDRLDRYAEADLLRTEYDRDDRYWKLIYYQFDHFQSQFDGCVRRVLNLRRETTSVPAPSIVRTGRIRDREPSEDVKEQVKIRDGNRCQCCGAERRLEIDHVASSYRGGGNELENLQTLCKDCNGAKGTAAMRFRLHASPLAAVPAAFPELKPPKGADVREPLQWERFLRRSINLFYGCAAVHKIEIGKAGAKFRHWRIRLYDGNDPMWLYPHLDPLRGLIRLARADAGLGPAPDHLTVGG